MISGLHHFLTLSMRVIFAGVGALFIYMAVFMYADERGKYQNQLINIWIKTKQLEGEFDRGAVLLRYSSQLARFAYDRLFGKRLISVWSVAISVALSLSSAALLAAPAMAHMGERARYILFGLALLVYGLLAPQLYRSKKIVRPFLAILILALLIFTMLFTDIAYNSAGIRGEGLWRTVVEIGADYSQLLVFGVLSDITLVIMARSVVSSMSVATRRATLLGSLCANFALCAFLFDTLSIALPFRTHDDAFTRLIISNQQHSWYVFGARLDLSMFPLLFSTNFFTFVLSMGMLGIVGLAIIHPLIWPLISRLVNAIYEWEFLTNKKLQVTLGATFLALALSPHGLLIASILKKLGITP